MQLHGAAIAATGATSGGVVVEIAAGDAGERAGRARLNRAAAARVISYLSCKEVQLAPIVNRTLAPAGRRLIIEEFAVVNVQRAVAQDGAAIAAA